MNQFKENLKITEVVEDVYNKQGQTLEFRDKVALTVYNALTTLEVKTEQEKREKQEFIMSINNFIYHYDNIKPVMIEALSEEKRRKMEFLIDKFVREERERGSESVNEK